MIPRDACSEEERDTQASQDPEKATVSGRFVFPGGRGWEEGIRRIWQADKHVNGQGRHGCTPETKHASVPA